LYFYNTTGVNQAKYVEIHSSAFAGACFWHRCLIHSSVVLAHGKRGACPTIQHDVRRAGPARPTQVRQQASFDI